MQSPDCIQAVTDVAERSEKTGSNTLLGFHLQRLLISGQTLLIATQLLKHWLP
jgi:hypothetical protein